MVTYDEIFRPALRETPPSPLVTRDEWRNPEVLWPRGCNRRDSPLGLSQQARSFHRRSADQVRAGTPLLSFAVALDEDHGSLVPERLDRVDPGRAAHGHVTRRQPDCREQHGGRAERDRIPRRYTEQ